MEKKATSWWSDLGPPQYGGEIVLRSNRDIANFDPYFYEMLPNIDSAWMERLFADDWTRRFIAITPISGPANL